MMGIPQSKQLPLVDPILPKSWTMLNQLRSTLKRRCTDNDDTSEYTMTLVRSNTPEEINQHNRNSQR